MNNIKPKISIIMPVYNGEDYLKQAIESMLGQSFREFELIIINDGSSDSSESIIESYKLKDARIKFISRENRGLISTLNEGLQLAKGKYIARMDADDISHTDRLNKQYNYMEAEKNIGVLGCDITLINHSDVHGNTYHFPQNHDQIKWAMFFLCPIVHPSVMMRRENVISVGGYNKDALHAEDYDLWHRLINITQFANLPEPMLLLRKHDASITKSKLEEHLKLSAKVYSSHISEYLGRKVSENFVSKIMKNKIDNKNEITMTVNYFLELLNKFTTENEDTKRIINCDIAMRIGQIGFKSKLGFYRIYLIYKATTIFPIWWYYLGKRLINHVFGLGVKNVLG